MNAQGNELAVTCLTPIRKGRYTESKVATFNTPRGETKITQGPECVLNRLFPGLENEGLGLIPLRLPPPTHTVMSHFNKCQNKIQIAVEPHDVRLLRLHKSTLTACFPVEATPHTSPMKRNLKKKKRERESHWGNLTCSPPSYMNQT